jgi:hypothetical protein
MHTQTKEQTAMDATRHNTITIIIIGFIGLMFTACTTNKQPQPEPVTIEYATADQYGPPAQAIAELAEHLQTNTTISTNVPKPSQNSNKNVSVPEYRNDHADMWDVLAQCETGGNWSANTGNGYGGGLQFAHTASWSTWRTYGGEQYAPHPWEATREQQIDVGQRVLESAGFKAWPGCARKHGWL